MARVVILTRARHDRARLGRPASARYTPDRDHPLASALHARGHEVVVWWDEPDGPCLLEDPDVVYLRAGGGRNLTRAEAFEEHGARVLSSPAAHQVAADKLLAAQVLDRAGVATPRTSLDPATLGATELVAKPRSGQGGTGVRRTDVDRARRSDGVVFQPYLEARRHLRFTVVDGVVLVGERRRTADGEFRANLAAGADTEALELADEPEAASLAAAAARSLDLALAGVDVLVGEAGPVVLEANPASTLWHPLHERQLAVADALAALA